MLKDDDKKRSIYPSELFSLNSLVFITLPTVASVAFLLIVVVASDYDTSAVFSMGFITGLFFLCLTWETKRKRFKQASVVFVLIAIALAGTLFIRIGNYQKNVNRIVARHMLQSVGQALQKYIVDNNHAPKCKWTCMTRIIAGEGYWKGLSIPYENSDQSITFEKIPMKDGWGCRYYYDYLVDDNFILRSSGPDRKFNYFNDISYDSKSPPPTLLPSVPVFPKRKAH